MRLFEQAFGKRPAVELYDLRNDPWQMRNVADDPQYARDRDGLADELQRDYRATLDRFLMLEAQGSEKMREELRLLRAEAFAHGAPHTDVLCDGLGLLENTDLRTALPTLAMPSLWIAGRRDRLVSPSAMQAAADMAPQAAFHQVGSGGHAPFLTQADEVAGAVRGFAAGLP